MRDGGGAGVSQSIFDVTFCNLDCNIVEVEKEKIIVWLHTMA